MRCRARHAVRLSGRVSSISHPDPCPPHELQQSQPVAQPPLLILRTSLTMIAATIAASTTATMMVPRFSCKNSTC
jgi:hypothetical protein